MDYIRELGLGSWGFNIGFADSRECQNLPCLQLSSDSSLRSPQWILSDSLDLQTDGWLDLKLLYDLGFDKHYPTLSLSRGSNCGFKTDSNRSSLVTTPQPPEKVFRTCCMVARAHLEAQTGNSLS